MEQVRKTKIICTMGPSTEKEVLEKLMLAGMNVARFNFSHGDHEEQMGRLTQLRATREKLGLPVAALLDTKGPEIRLREFAEGKVMLEAGQTFTLTTDEIMGDENRVSVSYKDLPKDVAPGTHILIDDGLIEMTVTDVTDTDIICKVINGGKVSNKKGVNVPNVELSMDYVSPKDYKDIVFAVKEDFDFIAASFVRTAADGIMVARGDMGVEIPIEEVPIIQKMIIKKAYHAGKVVVTATQMLDSMMSHPRPTRAEATDVANAIYDGTSAIMLSGETAAGDYPVEAVETMVRIALRTEADINYISRLRARKTNEKPSITDAISHTACLMAGDLNATSIVTVTKSGRTARMISKYRPQSPIIGGCMSDKVCRQLNLSWGVIPLKVEEKQDADELFDHALERSKEAGLIQEGDTVVLTAGVPLGIAGTTNLLKAHIV